MGNRRKGAPAWIALLAIMPVSMALQAQDKGVHRCASVVAPEARLACYDDAFPPPPPVLAAAAERQQRSFGLERQRQDERKDEQVAQLQAKVISLAYRSDGTRVVDLDSGQQWLVSEPTSRGHVVEGDRVTLRKAALGSYMLVTAAGVPLRARRLR